MFSCMKYTVPQEMCQGSLPSNFSLDSQPSMGSGCTTPRMFHISSRTDLYWVAQPLTQVFSFLARREGVEPSSICFGDRTPEPLDDAYLENRVRYSIPLIITSIRSLALAIILLHFPHNNPRTHSPHEPNLEQQE